ncbi:MAG: hypothetical protein CL463_03810 [Acidimicrobiaceae bacterium]|nr:hypothetical protein [Acidimicrobiaceae bacterium]|tara:strand:- start:1379 stop:2368 length:990 start_codon:yes stop_codon:yes gene_type:complete
MSNLPSERLPLGPGDSGKVIEDLHRLLESANFPTPTEKSTFTKETAGALRDFQESRHLETTGICDLTTWYALIEAGYLLGDRLLYLQSPMLRGDDIAELQKRLGTIGFDSGQVDGIFGENTEKAVREFQRNAGLPVDAIFGPDSLQMLNRLGDIGPGHPVAAVREHESLLTRNTNLNNKKVVLGEVGGLGSIVNEFSRELISRNLHVEMISHYDEHEHAELSNSLDVDLYFGITSSSDYLRSISYFSNQRYISPGGASLANALYEQFLPILGTSIETVGRANQVLRETRMPAIVLCIGPTSDLVAHGPVLAVIAADVIVSWLTEPYVEE